MSLIYQQEHFWFSFFSLWCRKLCTCNGTFSRECKSIGNDNLEWVKYFAQTKIFAWQLHNKIWKIIIVSPTLFPAPHSYPMLSCAKNFLSSEEEKKYLKMYNFGSIMYEKTAAKNNNTNTCAINSLFPHTTMRSFGYFLALYCLRKNYYFLHQHRLTASKLRGRKC